MLCILSSVQRQDHGQLTDRMRVKAVRSVQRQDCGQLTDRMRVKAVRSVQRQDCGRLTDRMRVKAVRSSLGSRSSSSTVSSVVNSRFFHSTLASPICSTCRRVLAGCHACGSFLMWGVTSAMQRYQSKQIVRCCCTEHVLHRKHTRAEIGMPAEKSCLYNLAAGWIELQHSPLPALLDVTEYASVVCAAGPQCLSIPQSHGPNKHSSFSLGS